MDEMDSKYHVGDRVHIYSVDNCKWGKNHHMEELIGETRTIKKVFWSTMYKCYGYYIENDNDGSWTWDDSCFEPAVPIDLPEFIAESIASVLGLFS